MSGKNNPCWRGGPIKKICEICGNEYSVSKHEVDERHTCGRSECKSEYRNRNRVKKFCNVCRKEYFIKKSQANKSSTCGNPVCISQYRSALTGERSGGWRGGPIKKICEICGEEYYIGKSLENKICTCRKPECTSAYINRKSIKKICEICGEEYYVSPSRLNEGRTCGKPECKILIKLGENNPNWKGGQIKKNCEVCGEEYYVFQCNMDRLHTCGNSECNSIWKSMVAQGIKNVKDWTGYAREELYCEKFTSEFKNRQYEFQNFTCLLCGEHVDKPHCHHVYWQKASCCQTDDELGNGYFLIDNKRFYYTGSPNKFAVLCNPCHGIIKGRKKGKSKFDYIRDLEQIIIEKYGDKSYFTKEEYWGNGYYRLPEVVGRERYCDAVTGEFYGRSLSGFQGYGLPKLKNNHNI